MIKVWIDIHLICVVEVGDEEVKEQVKEGSLLHLSHSCCIWAKYLKSHSVLYILKFEINEHILLLLLVISKSYDLFHLEFI